MKLTEQDLTNLRWMEKCNKKRIGFLGPSSRWGAMPELDNLVKAGLATFVIPHGRGDKGGYWITDAGRQALATSGGRT